MVPWKFKECLAPLAPQELCATLSTLTLPHTSPPFGLNTAPTQPSQYSNTTYTAAALAQTASHCHWPSEAPACRGHSQTAASTLPLYSSAAPMQCTCSTRHTHTASTPTHHLFSTRSCIQPLHSPHVAAADNRSDTLLASSRGGIGGAGEPTSMPHWQLQHWQKQRVARRRQWPATATVPAVGAGGGIGCGDGGPLAAAS